MARSSVMVPYASYLRVYEPLAAFPEPERSYWYAYAGRGAAPGAQEELRASLAGLARVPQAPVPDRESREAFVAEVGGVVHVCPWRTRLRGWLALKELKEELPPAVLDALLPPAVRGRLEADHERWRGENPDARPWIRSAAWHVPVRWFVLFDDAERVYEPAGFGGPAADGGEPGSQGAGTEGAGVQEGADKPRPAPSLRYRTPMVQARRRVARGLRALREASEEDSMIESLVDVGRWLEDFHPRSLVELDYGGLVHVIPEGRLAQDRSAADVGEGLAALREGDGVAAGRAYERLTARWRGVRELQYAS
ncbi:hypothetical protein GCM10010406_31710 [Streptomyces thermolineatus]|uniref:DUF8083 domain-containing protein n=2 Tax=Streptomyces thermolineatus TaxID=44033 RepID=A0ABP5Z9Z9_9ACTN